VPFFFDLSSLLPTVERNPFEPVLVSDNAVRELELAEVSDLSPEMTVDLGLPIPAGYNLDLMRALVQDPFHLFVHWQLKDDPYERLRRIFPTPAIGHSLLPVVSPPTRHCAPPL